MGAIAATGPHADNQTAWQHFSGFLDSLSLDPALFEPVFADSMRQAALHAVRWGVWQMVGCAVHCAGGCEAAHGAGGLECSKAGRWWDRGVEGSAESHL